MTQNQFIAKVSLRMDEVSPDDGLSLTVDGSDNNPLYALISGIADDCVIELYSVAPYWRLPQTNFLEADMKVEDIPENSSRKYIRIKLGDNFLRVAEILCSDFARPITEVFPEGSPEGKRQHNKFLLGKETKPVGVLSFGGWSTTVNHVTTTEVCREIDCYSLASGTTVTASSVKASYIARPTNAWSVPDILQPALQWLTAARAFGARGDANHAQICQQNAQNLLV